ncbi:amino acid permease [Shigella sonnei]
MEKKLGNKRTHRAGIKLNAGRGRLQSAAKYGGNCSPAALLIGWVTTGAGILLLAFAMLILTHFAPNLTAVSLPMPAKGLAKLIGFCSAWGYWLCAVIANVSYLVIVFSALSVFTDTPEIACSAMVIPAINRRCIGFIVDCSLFILRGVQTAASINLVATLAKSLPLGLFVVLAMMMFKLDTFKLDFTGLALAYPCGTGEKHHAITLDFHWCGRCRGCSARARNKRDVGKATLLAVLSALGVYLLVTLLSLGVVARPNWLNSEPVNGRSDGGNDGTVGQIIIAAGLIVSVCGAYLSWTIMAVQVPFLAATHKAFPRIFARQNAQAAPSASLWLTNICVNLSGAHLADQLPVQHIADHHLRNDSGALFTP